MTGDKKAKKTLRRKWPGATQDVWDVPTKEHFWLRAQPVQKGDATAPRLSVPGSPLFKNQPDGLWILLSDTHADIVAVEACGSRQNLEQRRSKYSPDTCARIVECSVKWLAGAVNYKKGTKARWALSGAFSSAPNESVRRPVRHVRVLYALPDAHYDSWSSSIVPAGHEYFCKYSSLASITSKKLRTFLYQLSIHAQYYTKVKGGAV